MLRLIGFVTGLALLLVGCGGGGGGGGAGGDGASYTVGGAVTGLTGSGLVLRNNGGGDLAVSASGVFTFATKIANGAAYTVTVYTQPAIPSQTCVVTNGSGTMGSSNVTNVTVSCTLLNGFTGFISGPYIYTDIGALVASSGPDVFDGAGGFSGSYVRNVSGVISSGPFSGTYTAAAGGVMTLNGLDGGVSTDGNTILFADLFAGGSPYVDVEIKQGQTNFTNADFIGTYQLASISTNADASSWLALTADGMGTYSGTVDRNDAGVITSGAVTGTYTVAADGSLTIAPAGGSPFTGGISADGKSLVLSQLTAAQPAEFAVGIKQGRSDFTIANVIGTYVIIYFDGYADILLTLTFDGAGLFQGTGTLNDAGTISSIPVTGAYTVAADGSLTLTVTGESSFTGGVSADGNTLMFTDLNAGNRVSILFGVRR